MQIELIGCSCAGKSTLAQHIVQSGRQQRLDVVLADDFTLRQLGLQWIENRLLRRALLNVVAVIAGVLGWRRNRHLYFFAGRLLWQTPVSWRERATLMRNVLKKVGFAELAFARSGEEQIIVLDEGVVHVAHNLFVHVPAAANGDAVPLFAQLVRLPDVIVYVRAPEPALIERLLRRGHRRIADPTHDKVVRFVRQAVTTFDKLVEDPVVAERTVVVDGVAQPVTIAGQPDDPRLRFVLDLVRPPEQQYVA